MRSSCKHLQQQAAISRLTSAGEMVAPKESPNQPYLAVAASIKLLMVVPERIWGSVEAGRRAEAAQLFLLAQYVHTGLEGGAGGGLTPEKISAWFPVVARQWATVRTLQASLLSRQGSLKVVISVYPYLQKTPNFSRFYKKLGPFYKKLRCDKFGN